MKNSTQLLPKRDIESTVTYAIISMLRNFLILSPNSFIFRQMLGKRVIIIHHQHRTIALPLLCKYPSNFQNCVIWLSYPLHPHGFHLLIFRSYFQNNRTRCLSDHISFASFNYSFLFLSCMASSNLLSQVFFLVLVFYLLWPSLPVYLAFTNW